tara:strand:- start:182 stop:1171 length:990 start_codon:yes stop_codon:yes gene_type:complete
MSSTVAQRFASRCLAGGLAAYQTVRLAHAQSGTSESEREQPQQPQSADVAALAPRPPPELRRLNSDPKLVEFASVQELVCSWIQQEEHPGYFPPDCSWPWPAAPPAQDDIPMMRAALAKCGSAEQSECHEVAFRLATSLLGGTLDGHVSDGDRNDEQLAEGADLMRRLADSGSIEGACGWAYCLAHGDVVPEDQEGAAHFYRKAAQAGCAQSMHELGIIHYLSRDSADVVEAVRWFEMAAEKGVAGSMYLLAECLLEGLGTQQDLHAALGWFAAAGELGHRSARSRIIARAETTSAPSEPPSRRASTSAAERYQTAAGRRGSEWKALVA